MIEDWWFSRISVVLQKKKSVICKRFWKCDKTVKVVVLRCQWAKSLQMELHLFSHGHNLKHPSFTVKVFIEIVQFNNNEPFRMSVKSFNQTTLILLYKISVLQIIATLTRKVTQNYTFKRWMNENKSEAKILLPLSLQFNYNLWHLILKLLNKKKKGFAIWNLINYCNYTN